MKTEPMLENDNLNKEILQWSCKSIASLGYTLKSNQPEKILATLWSYVGRFETSDGYIYLKHTPPLIALEAIIIQVLRDQFHAPVPTVIAHNTALNCFLMKDAGQSLRGILKQKFDEALICKAIDQFISLQLAVADQVDVFLDIGVPDWRLDKLPNLYKNMIKQKDLLAADGLSAIEINKLDELLPKIANLCKKGYAYSIKQTIVQPDFSDNNILIDNISQNITIIDLGEITISHPFFSLLNCFRQIKKHYALTETDELYVRIKQACFKHYMNFFGFQEQFLDAFTIISILCYIYDMLSQYRLMLACGTKEVLAFQQRKFSNTAKEFIVSIEKF